MTFVFSYTQIHAKNFILSYLYDLDVNIYLQTIEVLLISFLATLFIAMI
jgi:hypothetical protein